MSFELRGPGGKVITLQAEWLRMGRAKDNDIVLAGVAASRYHLNLYLKDGALIVEDAGSQNGFVINGQNTKEAVSLKAGDRLRVGDEEFLVAQPGVPSSAYAGSGNTKISSIKGTSDFTKSGVVTSRSVEDPERKRRLRIMALAAVLAVVVLAGVTGREEVKRQPASTPLESIANPLDASGIENETYRPRGLTEIQAEAKFKEALRDYNNRNYTRAYWVFQESWSLNPENQNAKDYIQYTENRLKDELEELMKDGERSLKQMKYVRAKAQMMRILAILSDQMYGYSEQLSRSLASTSVMSKTQEEILLKFPCESSKDATLCKKALDLLIRARQRLGDEDSVK